MLIASCCYCGYCEESPFFAMGYPTQCGDCEQRMIKQSVNRLSRAFARGERPMRRQRWLAVAADGMAHQNLTYWQLACRHGYKSVDGLTHAYREGARVIRRDMLDWGISG